VGGTIFYFTSGSYAGTADKLTGFRATGTASASYAHAWLGDNDLPFVDDTFMAVSPPATRARPPATASTGCARRRASR
jgi:hypothetical protein